MKRLALNKDNKLTYCVAPDDKIGKGKCNHIDHQKDGESNEEFIKRINDKFDVNSKNYIVNKNDLDNYIKEHENDEDFDEKIKLYRILMDYDLKYCLKGGFDIKINNLLMDDKNKINTRPTKDIDFNWWDDRVSDERKMIEELVNLYKENGYDASYRPIPKGYRIEFENTKERMHIDVIKEQIEYEGSTTLKDVLKMKLNLKLEVTDKRFKDLVDILTIIRIKYPNGISKKELLEMININDIDKFLNKESIEKSLKEAKKFHPKTLNDMSMEQHLDSFISLLQGIKSSKLSEDYHFYPTGEWRRRKIDL